MAEWPPQLPALKADLGIDATDERDDVSLQTQLDAAVAFVQRVRSGQRIGAVNFGTQVNVNTADLTELQTLTGVDATLAQAIIDGRKYYTLDQLAYVVNGGYCVSTSTPTVFDGLADQVTLAADPDDDLVLGTLRLAGRWQTRKRSPDGLIQMAELGSTRVSSGDPDIDRLLRIGRKQSITAVG